MVAREWNEREGRRNGTMKRRRRRTDRRMVHRASENIEGCTSRACMCAYACTRMRIGVYVCRHIRRQKLCVGRIQCKRKDEEYDEDDGRVQEGGRGREERQGETQRRREGERDGERERDVAKQRPSPISILIELNATSYLMPETRQKLQLNGDAISLYLPAHSS